MRVSLLLLICLSSLGFLADKSEPMLPPAATVDVDFSTQVKPILAGACLKCHARGQQKGGLSIETRKSLLAGGESGPAVIVGDSASSPLIHLASGLEPDRRMPQKGEPLSAEQIGLLRAWIDQGAKWPDGFSFGYRRAALAPRRPALPAVQPDSNLSNPIDLLLAPYFTAHGVVPGELVPDRVFARRVFRDLIGLLPAPEDLAALEQENHPHKRIRMVQSLLDDRRAYADHWLTFWNDALRNDYRGPGFIDNGRLQITGWLYQALHQNMPYDAFVRELVSPKAPGAQGFIRGIVWRGVVNASQRPEMQAAQNIGQLFLGTNLKCASCHDSFVNQWKLTDSYSLASVFASQPLELHRCDKPTGEISAVRFLYPELGDLNANASREERMQQLADLLTRPGNGRLSRTIVNRLWAVFFGRGLVEPLDDMDREPWHQDLLDWLAVDLVDHGYDLKHTMRLICTSRVYQLPAVGTPTSGKQETFVFRGPLVRRISAEQFIDGVMQVGGVDAELTGEMRGPYHGGPDGQFTAVSSVRDFNAGAPRRGAPAVRASLFVDNTLSKALGRPNREQIVTRRDSVATTLQLLELANGATLAQTLRRGAEQTVKQSSGNGDQLIEQLYRRALGRVATSSEQQVARDLMGPKPTVEGVEDLLWILILLPEFQLVQ